MQTLARSNSALPDDGVTAPKHVGAVLMSILMNTLKLFFKTIQLCISWRIKNSNSIKMCGVNVKKKLLNLCTNENTFSHLGLTYFGKILP